VKARGDSLGYRVLRFVQRNPVSIAAAAVVLSLLLGSLAWLGLTVRRVQAEASAARQRELNLEPALIRAYDRLGDLYQSTDPNHAAGEYRQAVQTAREFLQTHPEQTELRRDLAWAEVKLADLEPQDALALYTDALGQFAVFAKANATDAARQKDVMFTERKLGLIQFAGGNLVAALTSFSRALQIAEALPSSPELRRAAAACNFEMGEVLAANHEPEVAIGNFRKALDLYRDLAGSADRSVVKDRTTEGFETALEEVAADAPADLKTEITAELDRARK
jgi:tetratricopeptide (TPR) repeat protein